MACCPKSWAFLVGLEVWQGSGLILVLGNPFINCMADRRAQVLSLGWHQAGWAACVWADGRVGGSQGLQEESSINQTVPACCH